MDLEKLKTDVEAVFTEENEYKWEDVVVDVRESGNNIRVTASKMYDHLPLTFDTLLKLSELFGTQKFTVDNWSHRGCETCDYGSKYAHEFTFPTSAFKAAQAAKLDTSSNESVEA
jgi:hypothetical protein